MSALLSEQDLNDFISPGLACVKPIETHQTSGNELEVGKEPSELEKVSISLQDCLACAGCITSSEEILLSRQSHTVFVEAWRNLGNDTQLAVSVSPQSRISLAEYYGMPLSELDVCLANLFRGYFQCRYLVGTQIGRSVTITRSNRAILAAKQQGGNGPLLSAVCPGFVLYAEKTKPELVPHLLNVQSPQQITGALLKLSAGQRLYHLAVMPCFDKKLEASRPDGEQDVDCVITPRELVAMLQELGVDLRGYRGNAASVAGGDGVLAALAPLSPPGWAVEAHWTSNAGSSSGGFAYQYVRAMQLQHGDAELVVLQGRNSDVRELRLVDRAGATVASAAEVYGFRNIQNLVRRLTQPAKPRNARLVRNRRGASRPAGGAGVASNAATADLAATDFVEVMACPGGCINGGGLLDPPSAGPADRSAARKRALADQRDLRYARELSAVDPLALGASVDGGSVAQRPFQYAFHALAAPANDVVALGNTW